MAEGSNARNFGGTAANSAHTQPIRVFVALKIAPEVAQELAQMARPLEQYSIRPVAKEDIHLTLVPPWNESSVADASARLRRCADSHCAFTLEFCHVGYGPDPKRPHFLWVECGAGKELTDLRAALLLAFDQTDERPFLPHVTLARIRNNGALIARKCPIDRDLTLSQRTGSVELMRSPPPGERGYQILASLPLGQNRKSAINGPT